jgi:hypothetical protein
MKINVEDVKNYLAATRTGQRVCYICGEVEPECGFTPLLQVNVDYSEISRDLCNECYRSLWDNAQVSDERPEDAWGLKR